ncbi:hypothetical protein Murka_0077 [Xanthomonas phage Murka]|nr:hypothetical protein Murka_0077 [Xanthomonas phage Murka]
MLRCAWWRLCRVRSLLRARMAVLCCMCRSRSAPIMSWLA